LPEVGAEPLPRSTVPTPRRLSPAAGRRRLCRAIDAEHRIDLAVRHPL